MLNKIDENSFVSDIVTEDYRTASVFRKHDIDFCCGAKIPLEVACSIRGLNLEKVKNDLENGIRTLYVSNYAKFDEWDLDFLADYIVHIHHDYLRAVMPETLLFLQRFVNSHRKKYDYLAELENVFANLVRETLPHLKQEEEILFPYVKQIVHAYYCQESYASLLVRTLRKPVEDIMRREHETVTKTLCRLRQLTNDYTPHTNACTMHKVTFLKLREIDTDLEQHVHLESNILFPKAIAMERELLQRG